MTTIAAAGKTAFSDAVHLVFGTKYRELFTRAALDDIRDTFTSVGAQLEAELVEMEGEDDHVHLLVNLPPKTALAKLVNSLKGVSGRRPRQHTPASVAAT
jgi:putative transposase